MTSLFMFKKTKMELLLLWSETNLFEDLIFKNINLKAFKIMGLSAPEGFDSVMNQMD